MPGHPICRIGAGVEFDCKHVSPLDGLPACNTDSEVAQLHWFVAVMTFETDSIQHVIHTPESLGDAILAAADPAKVVQAAGGWGHGGSPKGVYSSLPRGMPLMCSLPCLAAPFVCPLPASLPAAGQRWYYDTVASHEN